MKTHFRLHILTGIMTFASLYCTAQEFQMGFKTGFSISQIKGDMEATKDLTGRSFPYFGISFGRRLSPLFNIKTELNYAPQGDEREGIQPVDPEYFSGNELLPANTTLYANYNKITRLNYLEVPILLQFYKETEEKEKERDLFFHSIWDLLLPIGQMPKSLQR